MINTASKIPKHRQMAKVLGDRIYNGQYSVNSQLPPVRSLSGEFGVSVNVIQRAIALLEEQRLVEIQHGVGVRVCFGDVKRQPLIFGLIHPYSPKLTFAGTIHQHADLAIDARENICLVKSSCQDAALERQLIEQFCDMGIEGMLVWPCAGRANDEFFCEAAEKLPMVFVDRAVENAAAPSVICDYKRAGRDIVQHLAKNNCRRALILEEMCDIATFSEMYQSMHAAVEEMAAEKRFEFASFNATYFEESYIAKPASTVADYTERLEMLLAEGDYDALFSPQDVWLDHVYANTDLHRQYPMRQIVTVCNTMSTPRTLAFLELGVRGWVIDFCGMFDKATDLLHQIVYRRSRLRRTYRIKFSTAIRCATGPQS